MLNAVCNSTPGVKEDGRVIFDSRRGTQLAHQHNIFSTAFTTHSTPHSVDETFAIVSHSACLPEGLQDASR